MHAATQTHYGTPDVLVLGEVERPRIRPDQVLVEVRSSVVTQGDRRMRAADFPGLSALFGRLMMGVSGPRNPIPGSMFAGRVVEVGAEVTRFAVGDDVFGSVMHGAYAEYIAVAAEGPIATMPANATYAEAAALPYGAGTALTFLRDLAKVQPGERVMIIGASGGVGRLAVQVARHLGAEVTAVLSRDADLARSLGARHIVDYRREPVIGDGRRYDVIFDTTEHGHFSTYRRALQRGGRYLSLYLSLRMLFDMARTRLFGSRRAIGGVSMGDAEMLEDIRDLAEAGAIRPVIAKHFALVDIAAAHRALEEGHLPGTVVVDVARTEAVLRAA